MPIRLTKTVKAILIICFAAFLVQQTGDQFFGTRLIGWFGLIPSYFVHDHRYWQLFTYSFMHGDVMHLFFNLMMLAFIGTELEMHWGQVKFLRYYLFCSISAGFVYVLLSAAQGGTASNVPLIGASGAIYGLLTAYGLLFGERVMLFMMLFPMKAKHFIWVLALIQLMTSVYTPGGGWTSLAHLSGMVAGFLYLWGYASLRAARKRRESNEVFKGRPKKRKASHLKLIVNNVREFDTSEDDPKNDPKTWH